LIDALETGLRDARDGERLGVDVDAAADDVRVGPQVTLPVGMS
jgi:hypothetical protein